MKTILIFIVAVIVANTVIISLAKYYPDLISISEIQPYVLFYNVLAILYIKFK